jgi:hypothetical protein
MLSEGARWQKHQLQQVPQTKHEQSGAKHAQGQHDRAAVEKRQLYLIESAISCKSWAKAMVAAAAHLLALMAGWPPGSNLLCP